MKTANAQTTIRNTKETLQLLVIIFTIIISILNIWLAYKLVPIEKNISTLASDVDHNRETITKIENNIDIIMNDVKTILRDL